MNELKAAAAGVAGGLVGAAIWAAIGHFAHREVGWVAWGVGGLVGLGVRLAAQGHQGVKYGVIAVLIAILSVVAGKFAAVSLMVSDAKSKVTDQVMISMEADQLCLLKRTRGERLVFPPGKTIDNAEGPADYPPGIWQEASQLWSQVPPAEQQQRIAEHRARLNQVHGSAFLESFSPFDILWVLLAAATAFRIGSGAASGD